MQLWFRLANKAKWDSFADVRRTFGSVDIVADNRLIFDIGGDKFRLVVHASFEFKALLIKFVGTHKEYDKIDPETV